MPLNAEQTGPASCKVREGEELVCEVSDLRLRHARFRPGGRALIGGEVPLPLYWEQYARHEDSERNASSRPAVKIVRTDPEEIEILCTGSTGSGSVSSSTTLFVRRRSSPASYEYEIKTGMRVNQGMEWIITPNSQQGELEFCNLWADGVFSPDQATPLRYQATYVRKGENTFRIPHHHLESTDKENIPLSAGDQVAWLLEDENLCCTLLDTEPVAAALCAYMWDLHLAYRVCREGETRRLPAGTGSNAHFRLSSLTREEGVKFMKGASERISVEPAILPAFANGIALLQTPVAPGGAEYASLWPWEKEILRGDPAEIRFAVEPAGGPEGRPSLALSVAGPGRAAWKVSGLGPAFRQPPFPEAARYRFTSLVRRTGSTGRSALSIRLHRVSTPGLFDTSRYEVFTAIAEAAADRWERLECVTPPIAPSPDRLHLLCEHHGEGSSNFADVHFEILP